MNLYLPPQKVEKRFHNGDSFHYRVFWREAEGAGTETNWKHEDVSSPPFLVVNTSTYKRFEIKVQALNSIGKGPEPETRIGYSAEESKQPLGLFSLKPHNGSK